MKIVFLLISILLITQISAIEVNINYDISDNMAMNNCYATIRNFNENVSRNVNLNCNENIKTISLSHYGIYEVTIIGIDNASNENSDTRIFEILPIIPKKSGRSSSDGGSRKSDDNKANTKTPKISSEGEFKNITKNITIEKKEKEFTKSNLLFPILIISLILIVSFLILKRVYKSKRLDKMGVDGNEKD